MGVINDLGISIPGLPSFAGMGSSLLSIAGFVVFMIILGTVVYFFYQNKQYKYKIQLFENTGGAGYIHSGSDKAKLVRLGDGGEMILYLKNRKCYRTAYGRKMGNNTYWFAVGQDGYWYNFILGDYDAKKGELDIEPIDRDMRYMHVAIRKNITDRYRKIKFMDKYGSWIMAGVFIIIMIFGIWFLLSQMAEIASTNAAALQTASQVMKGNQEVLSALNNLIGNSGLRAA